VQFLCHEPFSGVSRVIDTARRLDLAFARLTFDRLEDGRFRLGIELADENSPKARVFTARLAQIIELEPETAHA
jgi:hypothetical protein